MVNRGPPPADSASAPGPLLSLIRSVVAAGAARMARDARPAGVHEGISRVANRSRTCCLLHFGGVAEGIGCAARSARGCAGSRRVACGDPVVHGLDLGAGAGAPGAGGIVPAACGTTVRCANVTWDRPPTGRSGLPVSRAASGARDRDRPWQLVHLGVNTAWTSHGVRPSCHRRLRPPGYPRRQRRVCGRAAARSRIGTRGRRPATHRSHRRAGATHALKGRSCSG